MRGILDSFESDECELKEVECWVGELLELQNGLGAPVLLEGGCLTVMAEGA